MALLEGAPMLVAQTRRRYSRSSPHPSAKTISAPPHEPRWRATDEASALQRHLPVAVAGRTSAAAAKQPSTLADGASVNPSMFLGFQALCCPSASRSIAGL